MVHAKRDSAGGAFRGAEFDRAFVSLVGFIDTESGRFVKIGGDLLGSDGGAGIRGKRRKMSSSWSRVLSKLGEASLRMAGGFAGSVGRRPIVINDAFGSYGGRVTNELDGALLGRDRNSFVEVAAGSSGYMMITDLPEAIQGVDALSRLSGQDLKERSDVDQPRKIYRHFGTRAGRVDPVRRRRTNQGGVAADES